MLITNSNLFSWTLLEMTQYITACFNLFSFTLKATSIYCYFPFSFLADWMSLDF